MLEPSNFDLPAIMAGVSWFHSGGIYAATGPNVPDMIIAAMKAARAAGAVVSLDLNFRELLWGIIAEDAGDGQTPEQAAQSAMARILPYVDVLFGNEEDLQRGLGIAGPDVEKESDLDPQVFLGMIADLRRRFENIQVVATTLREVISTNKHRWSAVA